MANRTPTTKKFGGSGVTQKLNPIPPTGGGRGVRPHQHFVALLGLLDAKSTVHIKSDVHTVSIEPTLQHKHKCSIEHAALAIIFCTVQLTSLGSGENPSAAARFFASSTNSSSVR
jgi:hypothetical protein